MRVEQELAYAEHDGLSGAQRHLHVPRPQLVEEIGEGLRREGVVVLRAPWGYGKTTLLRDFAQYARERCARPIVSVDFSSPEVMAYMSGSDGELGRFLADDAQDGRGQGEPQDAGVGRHKERDPHRPVRIPSRYVRRASRAIWLHLRWLSSQWCRGLSSGVQACPQEAFGAPVVLVDDLPKLDAAGVADLARAFRFWSSRGAMLVVACTPSAGLDTRTMPRALFLGPDMLGVSPQETGMWVRRLSIARDIDVESASNGVPMLVGACARVRSGDAGGDLGFLHACELVMSHVLAEPLSPCVSQARRAMAVLGQGRLSEVLSLGIAVSGRELEELAANYPVLGVDFARGTFRCPPLVPAPSFSCVRLCVEDDERLGAKCVERLLGRGEAQRAGAVLGFLPPLSRARLLEAHPAGFADVLGGEVVCQTLDDAQARGFVPGEGSARLRSFSRLCRDAPPEGATGGFAADVACVLAFWQRFAGPTRSCGQACEAVADIVAELGEAGLVGDVARYEQALVRLESLLASRPDEGLGEAVLCCHAAVCGVFAGCAGRVRAWLAPLVQRVRVLRANPSVPGGVADALLSACLVLAGDAEEPPGPALSCSELDAVRACKKCLTDLQVGFGVSLCAAVEAFLLMLSGDAPRAEPLADTQLRRWSQSGCCLGQAMARLSMAACCLAQARPSQARGHAAVAFGVAQRMRLPRLERVSRLFLIVALLVGHSVSEIGEHELAVCSQCGAQRGRADVVLLLSEAVLAAGRGDADEARDALEAFVGKADPVQMRLAVCVAGQMGDARRQMVECMPAELLREYRALREPRRRPSRAPMRDEAGAPAGAPLLAGCDRGLSVSVFGCLGGKLNGRPIESGEWGRTKGLYLTCLLALAPSGRMARSDLADILYSSTGRRQRASALGTTLSCLRTALGQVSGGPEYIVGSMGTLGLNYTLVSSDVARFEAQATALLARRDELTVRETVEECDALVRLFGTGPDARLAELHESVARRCEQLCDLFAECMLAAVDACYVRGEFEAALGFARHAALVAPDRADVADACDVVLRARARKAELHAGGLASPAEPPALAVRA